MNPEAISAIKKAAALSKTYKEAILGCSFEAISRSPEIIFSGDVDLLLAVNYESTFRKPEEIKLKENDLIKIKIITGEGSCKAKTTFSLYFGKDELIMKLAETNRQAVIDTCQSLCPGLSQQEIIEVIELSREEFQIIPELTKIENLNAHSRLMAGDILYVSAAFEQNCQNGNKTVSSIHSETILITGNGAQILTS